MDAKFTFENKQKRAFFLGSGIGLVLLILGLLLSTMGGGDSGHGDGHDDDHASVKTALADASGAHGKLQEHEGEQHDGEGHGDDHDADSHEHGSAHGEGEHADEAHGAHEHHIEAVHEEEPDMMTRIGTVFLVGNWYFLCLGVFGVFFIAVNYLANSGWYVVVKRILESYYRWIPVAAVLMLALFWGFKSELYLWAKDSISFIPDASRAEFQHLIDHKSAFLNPTFYTAAIVLVLGFYFFMGHKFRQQSLKEELEGGSKWFFTGRKTAAVFMPIFALSFSMIAFQWMMSLDVTWFSTIYSVYCFAGMFVLGMTTTTLIIINLKEKGYLPEINSEHFHDLGKFMFAFSIFWAYIWISQYLLIWYANIPEEGFWYIERFENYSMLFWLNFLLNFLTPFLAFMTRDAKRQLSSLKKIGIVMLFGRFLDVFLLVMPGTMSEHWNIGMLIAAAGMVLLQGGIFLYLIYSGLEKAPLLPKNHPYLQESLHHDTGV